jgi:hypothetical protein
MRSATKGEHPTQPARMATTLLACSLLILLVILILPAPARAGASQAGMKNVKVAVNDFVAGSSSDLKAADVASYINSNNGGTGTPAFGPEKPFNNADTRFPSAAALSPSKFVVAYCDAANAWRGTAIIGTVSGKTISYGGEAVFNPATTYYTSVAALSDSHFVVAYCDRDNSEYGTAVIGAVTGSAITYGPEKVFNSASTSEISVSALHSGLFVVAYNNSLSAGTFNFGYLSGTTITAFSGGLAFNPGNTSYISVAAFPGFKCVVTYRDLGNSNYGTARIANVSTTVTLGPEKVFNAASTQYTSVATLSPSKFVASYQDTGNANRGTAVIGDISGTTITCGPEKVVCPADISWNSVTAMSASRFLVASNNSGGGTACICDVSGRTITCGPQAIFNTASTWWVSAATLANWSGSGADWSRSGNNYAIAYSDGSYSIGMAVVGGSPTTIGSISPTSGPPGTTVTIHAGWNAVFGLHNSTGLASSDAGSGASSYVSFNGVKATSYSKWTDTEIVCKVPEGATAGPVTVVVDGISSSNTVRFGATTPTWYLAEGTTAWGFGCYISIENPNTATVHAAITYMTSSGQVAGGTVALPAKSQATVNPADVLGQKDFSTKVVCTEGASIAVDRTMLWTGPGAAASEAHSSVGVTAPATTWYLPEGSSAWGFDCWLLIQNPNSSAASCQVTYMIEDGAPRTVTKAIPANSRQTFNIKDDIGEKNASIKVQSTSVPVIPERAMYRNNKREGHDSIGTTTPAADYYLAEGTTAWGFTTYVLVQNPNAGAASVTVTYMTPSGAKAQAPFSLAANSRKTIRVNDVAGMLSTDFSTQVHGTVPIIAERAMYWNNGTGEACHDSIGMDRAHVTFYLPDGQSSNGCETWTLVQNPNSTAVQVEISYMTPNGQGNVVKTETIPASSRQTFGMLSHSGINGRASIMVTSKTAGKPIMVERAMYWNNKGAGTDTIGGFSD